MGLTGQVNHPDVVKVIDSVKETCLNKGIAVSIFTTDSQGAISSKEAAYSLIAVGVDVSPDGEAAPTRSYARRALRERDRLWRDPYPLQVRYV